MPFFSFRNFRNVLHENSRNLSGKDVRKSDPAFIMKSFGAFSLETSGFKFKIENCESGWKLENFEAMSSDFLFAVI